MATVYMSAVDPLALFMQTKIWNNLTFPVQRQRLLATLEHVLQ